MVLTDLVLTVVVQGGVDAAFEIEVVKHAPSYGHVDVARALIEQGAELAWADEGDEARLLVDPDDVAAADIEAFSRACDDRDDLCDALLDSDSDV